jgi:hypothetical protein
MVAGISVIAALVAFDTVICKGCCLDEPLESETETAKLNVPLSAGVPEMVPVLSPRATPWGKVPDAVRKV